MPECRICLQGDDEEELISPCNCRGSTRWVHRTCLNEWRLSEHNPTSRDQCEICLFRYIVSNVEPKETCIIKVLNNNFTFFYFFLSLIITFILGNLIMLIDAEYNYKTIKDFDLEHLNDKIRIEKDTWFLWTYYQGLSSFILNMVFYGLLNITFLFKVRRLKIYHSKMLCKNIGILLYSLNFIFLIYISKLAESTGMIGFWSPLFVSFHFYVKINYLKKHNRVLIKINEALPNEIVSSFQLNPLNEALPLTINEYVQDNSIQITAEPEEN